MDKLNLISLEDISTAINTVLYNHDLISKDIYLKCSKPKYISDLPGDLRSNDPNELSLRLDAIEEAIGNRESILQDAEKRINAKTKDNERLAKRVDKNIEKMDKAMDNIADESDKIVNKINKIDFESKMNNWKNEDIEDGGETIKNRALDVFTDFKQSHNNFFSMDLTDATTGEYDGAFDNYVGNGNEFHVLVRDLSNEEGIFTKGDVKNADISPNTKRIGKNIENWKKSGKSVTEDVESIENNNQDINYIITQNKGVNKEIDILLDEYERTYNQYTANGGGKRETPNPQMLLDSDAKSGDSFTFLPTDYDKYMV